VIGLDTNVVVRVLTRDDPVQAERAARLFAGGRLWLAKTVLLECEWVLRSAYSLQPTTILAAFRSLLGYPPLEVEDKPAVLRALRWYEAGLDFADALHLASLDATDRFASFDRGLAQRAAELDEAPAVDLL
jgi:predicted nucleic-acid-binding protein